MIEYLKRINDLPLVTGFEGLFIDRFASMIGRDFGIAVEKSGLNLVHLSSTKSNIVFLAHYDEIGFVVDNRYARDIYRTIPMGLISPENGYGKVFQTLYNDKRIMAIGSSPMPHTDSSERRLFLEILEEVDLPPLWPFTFENRVILSGDKLFSRALDNRANVILLLELARELDINFILTHGEEQGTTRLEETIRYVKSRINNPNFIVLDVIYSTSDQHADSIGIDENRLGYIPVEGGGRGNIAPENLQELVRRIADTKIETRSKYEVTDATTLYRMGERAISIVYGVRYLHSSLECINLNTYRYAKESILKLLI
ncbi:MAG: hypothetical protein QXD88_01230 [Candidatus Anstonellales archaeon]